MSNTYNPTDMFAPDYQHYQDEDKSQELVTSITGTTEVAPGQEREVEQISRNRQASTLAQREFQGVFDITRQPRVVVVSGSSEIILRSLTVPANVATKLVDKNFNRSRLIVSGTGANVGMSTNQNPSFIGVAVPNFDTVMIGFSGTFYSREIRTVQDIWLIADTATVVSVQEEFFV